jgi:ATP-dependent RNA helicase DeaD
MNDTFKEMGLSSPILKALEDMGFESPTEVQSAAIPHILNKEDLVVMSKTGSGKTAVFGVSILQMIDASAPGPQGLILTPTRELAVQIDNDLKKMSKYLPHKTTAVYGQHSMNIEIEALKRGVSIVSGTPGRVYDHITNGSLKTNSIRFLVLDEADRMLDMGFIDQVVRIIKTLPKNRITLLFSATIPPEIHDICNSYMNNPVSIEIESKTMTVDTTEQVYYRVNPNEKRTQLNRLLLAERPESCIVFCNTRSAVDRIQSYFTRKGYASRALHGDIPQSRRIKTIQQFKTGVFNLLVATDVAARGLHIDNLSLVINYDVPNDMDNYVHRIGRTGRAGNTGKAITLVTGDDIMSLYAIEEHIGALIPEAELPKDSDLREQREKTEQWIKANSRKPRPPRAQNNATGRNQSGQKTSSKKTSSKKPYSKSSYKRDTDKNRSSKAAKHGRPAGKTAPQNAKRVSSPYKKPFNQASAVKTRTPGDYTAKKSIHDSKGIKPVKNSQTLAPPQDSGAKKPFLKRILHKILGK